MSERILCGTDPLSLVLLAGGKSRRMKRNKALLPLAGSTLIEHILRQAAGHFDEVLISVTQPENFRFLPYPLVSDERPNLGPLMGIKSALSVSRHEKNFILACDIPEINFPFMRHLISLAEGWEAAVPIHPEGRIESLFAVYSKCLLPRIEECLQAETLSLQSFLETCRTRYVEIEEPAWLRNLNTEEDYREYMKSLKE